MDPLQPNYAPYPPPLQEHRLLNHSQHARFLAQSHQSSFDLEEQAPRSHSPLRRGSQGAPPAPSKRGSNTGLSGLRSRLMIRLGFEDSSAGASKPSKATTASKKKRSNSASSLGDTTECTSTMTSSSDFSAMLEDDDPTIEDDNEDQPPKRNVSFLPTVKVYLIPSKDAYPPHMRDAIWTSPREMNRNTIRNRIEFAAEQWDWRAVVEDEEMIDCMGHPVHPVHFTNH